MPSIFLSQRSANSDQLLSLIEKDPKFAPFLTGTIGEMQVEQAVEYLTSTYHCSKDEAEEAITHTLRKKLPLSNRVSQKQQISIPPTTDNPIGKTVPVEKTLAPQMPKDPQVSIDADPSVSKKQKLDDVTKPLTQQPPNRQQGIIDAIKALKVSVNELGSAMYGIAMTEEHQGKVTEKVIELVSREMADQVDDTVRSMASPLLASGA